MDSGALELDKVFELIMEGKNLLIDVEKELEVIYKQTVSLTSVSLIILFTDNMFGFTAVIARSKYALLHLSEAL